jgi:stage II sporulation protein R
MKKVIPVLFFLVLILVNKNNNDEYIIPSDAIRFRVIANSNTFEDQATKVEIKNNIETILKNDLITVNTKEEAKTVLNNAIPDIKEMINNYDTTYKINYGNNYFPKKTYKGVTYEEGYYESLVITLGSGMGDNWWCLMYPPLCLMETEEENLSDANYQLFIKNVFEKYM